MGIHFETLKNCYENGIWTKSQISDAVIKGWITAEEYVEITGEEYVPPLSEQEQLAIDTALNVEYIACLMEANLQQL